MADFKYKKTFEFDDSHKSYRPPKPVGNKILARKYDDAAYAAHRARVSKVKASIDNSPPKKHMHLQVKLKKIQLEEERAAQIEHDNRLLLTKMAKILGTKGAIDNRNTSEFKSLDRERRQRELVRIARENQAMLKRIQAKKPSITAASLEADFEAHLKLGSMITTRPLEQQLDTSPSKTLDGDSISHDDAGTSQDADADTTTTSADADAQ